MFSKQKTKFLSPQKNHNTQKSESQWDSAADIDLVPQESPSQSEGAYIQISRKSPNNDKGGPNFMEFDAGHYVKDKEDHWEYYIKNILHMHYINLKNKIYYHIYNV